MNRRFGITYQTKIKNILAEADDDKTAIQAMIKALELRKKAIDEEIKELKDKLRAL